MSVATGVGSMPGTAQRDFDEALRIVLGEVPDLPHLPEVPGRGVGAEMIGRALTLASGLGADLQPAGWRLVGDRTSGGVDQRRAASLLAQDLDALEEQTQGLTGGFKVQVTGPWTLAASVEKPRGDKVLSDHGARRDLAQSLAEGVREHVQDVRRRVGGADRLIVQVDEPALPAVLAGRVPTASGFGRHRTIHPPEASEALGWIFEAITAEGGEPWVHSCAPGVPWTQLVTDGVRGLSVDFATLTAADHDALAEALESGHTVALGVVASLPPAAALSDADVTASVLRWLEMLGLDPEQLGDRLVLTPACGLAGASASYARTALALVRTSAASIGQG